jgi:hypothetical protein
LNGWITASRKIPGDGPEFSKWELIVVLTIVSWLRVECSWLFSVSLKEEREKNIFNADERKRQVHCTWVENFPEFL